MGLLFDPEAFSEIPRKDTERLMRKIDWLWENRFVVHHFPLCENLSGYYKRRVGDYRIIYSYNTASDDLTIHLAGLRDTIYQIAADKLRRQGR